MYDHPQTTPIIPQPLIYAACDSGRDRNLCDQHENNIRLTTELNEKVKKKKGFQMKRPPRWFLWRRGAP